jgi:hypothetical protein
MFRSLGRTLDRKVFDLLFRWSSLFVLNLLGLTEFVCHSNFSHLFLFINRTRFLRFSLGDCLCYSCRSDTLFILNLSFNIFSDARNNHLHIRSGSFMNLLDLVLNLVRIFIILVSAEQAQIQNDSGYDSCQTGSIMYIQSFLLYYNQLID